ncbi:MAG: glycosyltransferase family 39 protein [Gaiellaceae bacterium]
MIAAAAVLPRLVVVLHERGAITAAFTDKGDDFARTFLASGTYGFIPGQPSAYTQPLYGFFLIPLFKLFGRSWEVVGIAQIAVALATAWLVYLIGRRVVSERAGVIAALLSTLHPYLVWHDVHMNREILDGLLAAALVLLTLRVEERPSPLRSALLGAVLGVAVLGNARLLLLPLVVLAWLLWRRRRLPLAAIGVGLAAFVLLLAPWVVRNRVSVGCAAITTDARALWKANNAHTYATLARGGWIDDVPKLPNSGYTPQETYVLWQDTGKILHVDECAQMRKFQRLVLRFWRDHPGEKAKLAGQATLMLWQPSVRTTEGRPNQGGALDTARRTAEPAFMIALYALALVGLFFVSRAFAVLAAALLAYQWLFAMLFAGDTRYRAPWDFLIAVVASAALARLWQRVRT